MRSILSDLLKINAHFSEEKLRHVFTDLQHAEQQVYRTDSLLPATLGLIQRLLNGLLRFYCKVIKFHIVFLFLFYLSLSKFYAARNKPDKLAVNRQIITNKKLRIVNLKN